MTVAEMIAELQKLPQTATVEIEGAPGAYTARPYGVKFLPEMVEGQRDGNDDVFAVIWAQPAPSPVEGPK